MARTKQGVQFLRFAIPIIDTLKELGGSGRPAEVEDLIAEKLDISVEEQNEELSAGGNRFSNQIHWARYYLVQSGYLDSSKRGIWSLTEKGRKSSLTESDIQNLIRTVQRGSKETTQEIVKTEDVYQGGYNMDFIDRIRALAATIPKQIEHIQTEEATKSALVMPFINALGYNVFDPTEVVPEFTADVGTKKGEKVDYAILKDKKPIILFECKYCQVNLDNVHASQLYRYFSVTTARMAVLTNGVVYRFYSDLEETNKMDSRPFLVFDMLDIQEPLVNELKKLTKESFDLDEMLSSASDLKYTREIKRILANELAAPSDDFVRFFGSQVYSGRMTQPVREQFTDIVKRAFNQFISEKINERLKSALATSEISAEVKPETQEGATEEIDRESRIETTEEELESYYIIKSILRSIVDASRIVHRDTISYFSILLDDNNRKPICRLYLNSQTVKYISLFDQERKGEKVEIKSLDDIYQYGDRLKATIGNYEK